ncbi:phosphonate ABC transporter, permease protein PhnE [Stappia sp. MMSF_3263]|uniref:phosphonate ABC transporter, permease protein PhnE n=1 Tax=Stappia sp. MMSF_3263 TaxID=3046693 RepID=UPI00273FBA23|nr:phosphonate ABC transporter, permease protein PhnE [Stappia sp. MMSF_3263]
MIRSNIPAVTLGDEDISAIAARHPDVFANRPWRRLHGPAVIAAIALYSVYCWFFFGIGKVLNEANWDIAGNYLADWVSYEIRPDFEIEPDGAMFIEWSRFSPLGAAPDPDWIDLTHGTMERSSGSDAATSSASVAEKAANSFMMPGQPGTGAQETVSEAAGAQTAGARDAADQESGFSFMAPGAPTASNPAAGAVRETAPQSIAEEVITRAVVRLGADNTVTITPTLVTLTRGAESLAVRLGPGEVVTPEGVLPDWAQQRYAGRKVVAFFGFTGRVEVDYDGVKVRHRFLGWENFVFDARSPFWGRSAAEVISLVMSGERLDPSRSNLALAWNNILYNADWQHLDVWTKLLQTIVMAFVGTLFASVLAFPLAFLAARNITRNRVLNQLNKRFFDFLRSVDMLIWALFFTRAFGPGPLAGISAIFFTDTGTLGKLYAEALENIDDKQREGVRSVGAQPVAVQRYGVLPQVLPVFASQALYFWESNTRSATIIGAVGAGGIGLKLWEAMRTNQDWENVAYMVLLILAVVFIFDNISNALRSRLMGASRP